MIEVPLLVLLNAHAFYSSLESPTEEDQKRLAKLKHCIDLSIDGIKSLHAAPWDEIMEHAP
jgi:hypothetical protein